MPIFLSLHKYKSFYNGVFRCSPMMLFVLSQKNLPLAQAEVASFYTVQKTKENYAFVSSKKKIDLPLAFTKEIHDILFSCSKKDLEKHIKKYTWNKKIKGSFCVRSDIQEIERKLGGMIWDTLKKPVVDLEHPDTLIHFFFIGNIVSVGLRLWKNDNAFLQRKAQLRPGFYPASLDPQLALGLVNLSSAKKNAVVVDPFCGIGVILSEALIQDLKVIGIDKDKSAIDGAVQNLKWFNFSEDDYVLVNEDSRRARINRANVVVTEPNLGKILKKMPTSAQTKKTLDEFENLIVKVFNNLKKKVKGRFVFSAPLFKTIDGRKGCSIVRIASKTEMKIVIDGIPEFRKDQIVGREIFVLE